MDDVTSSFGAVPNSAILNFSTPTSPYLRKLSLYAVAPSRIMAVGLTNGRHAADEEARAEVDVLNSRLEKTAQLTKKIQASLTKLEASGKSVREVVGPLNGETKRLQTLGHSAYSDCLGGWKSDDDGRPQGWRR